MQNLINQINEVVPIEVILPLIIIQILLMVIALISCIRSKTNGPKWLWIVIVMIFSIVGPVLYFVIGRKNE